MQKLLVLAFCALAAAQFYGGTYEQQQFYPQEMAAMPMPVDPYQQQQLGMAMQQDPYAGMYYPQQPAMQFAQAPYEMVPQAEEEESEEEAVEGEESEEESEESEEEAEGESFAETGSYGVGKEAKKAAKNAGKALANGAKGAGKALKKGAKAVAAAIKKGIKKGLKKALGLKKKNKNGKQPAKIVAAAAKGAAKGKNGKQGKNVKKTFKPLPVGKKQTKNTPSLKTPKAAGGRPLKPLPAPLPEKKKIDCKKDPKKCLEAETPAEGHNPGDHSPTAIFKKKLENIKASLMKNNRGIAQESKWIEEVEKIMSDYAKKVAKVKEHIADERKAIKELLRQRRLANNEKSQKELELKLKAASNELTSLTEALKQVQKKETELGQGKTTLKDKIKQLTADLQKLKGDSNLDKKSTLKKN